MSYLPRIVLGALASASLFITVPASAQAPATPAMPRANLGEYPPWQDGRNNDAEQRGLEFTVPEVDNLADFHGNPVQPMLVLFVGGNYFFAMAPLVAAFEARYPEYQGRLYWETLPPGLLVKQIKAEGTITVGNMTWTVKPDVYLAGLAGGENAGRGGHFDRPGGTLRHQHFDDHGAEGQSGAYLQPDRFG